MEALIAMMRDMADEFGWVVGPREWVLEQYGTDADIYTVPEPTLEH